MFRLAPAAALAAALFALPGQAAVTYIFVGDFTSARDIDGNPTATDVATFTVTLADPRTTDGLVIPDSCTTTNPSWTCTATGQWMNASGTPDGAAPPITSPVVHIGLNLEEFGGGGGTGFYFFEAAAFTTNGIFSTFNGPITDGAGGSFGNAGDARLTVSGIPTTPGTVPLPMSVVLFGTALAGLFAARRL